MIVILKSEQDLYHCNHTRAFSKKCKLVILEVLFSLKMSECWLGLILFGKIHDQTYFPVSSMIQKNTTRDVSSHDYQSRSLLHENLMKCHAAYLCEYLSCVRHPYLGIMRDFYLTGDPNSSTVLTRSADCQPAYADISFVHCGQ